MQSLTHTQGSQSKKTRIRTRMTLFIRDWDPSSLFGSGVTHRAGDIRLNNFCVWRWMGITMLWYNFSQSTLCRQWQNRTINEPYVLNHKSYRTLWGWAYVCVVLSNLKPAKSCKDIAHYHIRRQNQLLPLSSLLRLSNFFPWKCKHGVQDLKLKIDYSRIKFEEQLISVIWNS